MIDPRRSPEASAEPRDGASLPSAGGSNRKKFSVLVRRAALLAAIAVAIAVAVGLSVFFAAAALLPAAEGIAWVPALIAGAAALAAGFVSVRLLADRLMAPAFEPVKKLKDAAVAMSQGDLEIRADEAADGELGELGKAVNNLADQLSRNMYTLIVERNRLRNMLNGLSEGIVAIDREGKIRSWPSTCPIRG